uniref:Reverse transcriptase Ty1/copia-type domain-containing protein n=1 Tax=Tanacetum cinerariifolium TaxID=118510 RepID=A0A6L2NUJ6_TANCI|nr:hypothetical protein [Tanacetum cinerariifolium]
MSYLSEYEEINDGYVTFGGDPKGDKITDTECVVLSPDFKLNDESHVLLKVPRKDNMYSVDLKNVVPQGDLTCLFAKNTKFKLYETIWVSCYNSQYFRSSRTRIVEETLHITFLENKPNVVRSGPTWLFHIDTLTKSMKYKLVGARNQSNGSAGDEEKKDVEDPGNEDNEVLSIEEPRVNQEKDTNVNSTNNINIVSITANATSTKDNAVDENIVYRCVDDPNMPNLEEIVYSDDDENVGAEAVMTNLDTNIHVSPILTTRIHKDHPVEQIIRDIHSTPQTRRMTKNVTGHDYDEVFALVARIKAIRLFLAYASFKDFVVYHMDVKSAFPYGKIEEEVYVCQPSGFEDPEFPDRVYKEICTEFEKMMHKKFQMSSIRELTFFLGLQVIHKDDEIFISQDTYVNEILKKFSFSTVKTVITPMETSKPLMKDENANDVNVHLYRSMIGSLMCLTSLRPDIKFGVCVCSRFQVTPKVSHFHDVKRIFRYLKVQPKLGLWYPKDLPFNLEAYTDSEYAGASLDRKSTTGGCQFLRSRLISWQCKKQTIVANSTSKAEYVAASNCYEQVLWIQNQMLNYGYNFMNTKIFIDNESTICIFKNPVFHSKTKKFKIRHHFIRDSYEKRLIYMIKIHTDHNVVDLLTKAFDVSRFHYLIANETVHEDKGDRVERAATIAASLNAEQDSEDRPAQTRFKRLSKQSYEPPLLRVNILGSGKDSMQLMELMKLCIKLSTKVLVLENNKTAQDLEITHLKKRAKRLEKKRNSRIPQLKRRLFKVMIESFAKKSLGDQENASNQGRNDQDKWISFVQDLKNKSFKEVQRAFDKTMSWINSFVPMDKEVVEGSGKKAKSSRKEAVSKKRARKGLNEESVKRQKLEDDAEKEELSACLEIV